MDFIKKLFLLITFFFVVNFAQAQSVSGVPGYLRIPTATFNPDRTLLFGTSFYPQKYLSYTNYQKDGMAFFSSLTFLPFFEVDFRLTRQLKTAEGTHHTMDRMPSMRLRLLKEREWTPAVAIGTHDILSSLEDNVARHFNTTYIVFTKGTALKKLSLNVEGTIGYAVDIFDSEDLEMEGVFAGIVLQHTEFKWASLMLDYDSKTVNAGIRLTILKHIHILAGLQNFDAFTGALSYQFSL